ncbi:hypothetical protein QYE76_050471 [Lolium multiflorum]|uniref:Uncharacterized protein n=1 Tax=Lolium multiflorum TaxID=4521 RepID=A0AAD8SRP0_LOLMU|nr:hypothetical protein QYE76_050471 [Lolium multiflorum]
MCLIIAVIPKECYALVVSPRIDGYDFSKCLMDGGASLNIMYLETLEKMNLTKDQLKKALVEFLGANMDIFAWQPSDMSGVPRELAEHYLNINPGAKPVKQAMRRFGDKKRRAIGMELAKLLEAGATYQRTMQQCEGPNWPNVHAYVDDIAVMTRRDPTERTQGNLDNLRRTR